ncbi:uncharacterized protein LOC118221550 isoform X2 [Anguilla anguilla]|uniref:uncharacterized protein LOC118221550 isoform X2 n=1 Tax=Anguilla anguilla TaxID=7936 RepID=UPI0015A9EE15|nr:uncharacterized protein LOC118221550 isoform X2 [Anguilla anguilla]
MSSVPEKDLQEGMEVTLFCNASGGYPVGMIHWYDQHGTNWTRSAEMTVVETTDERMNLSSKFTLKASSITPLYGCLVLNNNGVEEGKAEFALKFQEKVVSDPGSGEGGGRTAIAVVFVIVGFLLCGLLILALLRRWCSQCEAGATRGGSCWRSHGGNGRRGTRAEEHLEGGFPAGAEGYVLSTPGDVAGPRQPSGPGGNLTGGTVEGPSAPIQSSVHVRTTPVPDQRQGSRTPEDTSSQVASSFS